MIRDDWIVDESRNIIEVHDAYFDPGQEITYLLERLEKLPEEYIKSIPRWYNQTNYVEVWVEKNAMAGVFSSILTKSRQVRIVPNGGWSSFSFESKNMRRLRYYQAMGKEGSSSGIGLETALILARNGYTTYATMRYPHKDTSIKAVVQNENLPIKVVQLDVTEDTSVKNAQIIYCLKQAG